MKTPREPGNSPRDSRALTVGLVLAVTMFAFEALAVTTAMPAVLDDLGGLRLYGAAFSAYMLATLFSLVVSGQQSDVHGPARPFALGLVFFAGGLLIAGSAPSMAVVVLGRALQGLGAGAATSTAYVGIARGYPPEARARMFAVLSAAWVVPGLLGPAIAGLVAEHVGWRWVFAGLLPLPVLVGALALPALRRLPPERDVEVEPARTRHALWVAAGAGLALAGLQERRWPVAVALLALGLPLGVSALRRLLPPGTARARPGLPAVVASRCMLALAFFGTEAFIPLAVDEVRGRSTFLGGLALTAAALTWTLAAFLQSKWAPRGRDRAAVRRGLLLVAAGIGLTMLVLVERVPPAITFVSWAVTGLGMGFAFNTMSVAALTAAPAGREGRVSSSLGLSDALGVAVGTGVGGAILGYAASAGWSTATGLGTVWTLMVVAVGMGLVAAGGVRDREPAKASVTRR